MPITTDENGKFTGGDYFWESRDAEDASIWPVSKGDEIRAAYFEDLRKHMFLITFPDSGNYPEVHGGDDFDFQSGIDNYAANVIADPDYPSIIGQSFSSEINWDGFRWICAGPNYNTFDSFNTADFPEEDFEYGLNNSNLFSSTEAWEAHKPPEQPNPLAPPTVFYNEFWRMAPETNLYSEYNKYSPVYEAVQDRVGGSSDSYLFLGAAKEILPEQIDIDLTQDGIGFNFDHIQEGGKNCTSGGGVTRFYNDAKDFKRAYITQIESLGTAYDPDYQGTDGNFGITYYTRNNGQAAGDFPLGNPDAPVIDSGNPQIQRVFEPQICAAYQNQLLRLLETHGSSIYLPVDDDYMKNRVEYDQWLLLGNTPEFDTSDYVGAVNANGPPSVVIYFSDGEWHAYRCNFYAATYEPNGVFIPEDWDLADVEWDTANYSGHNDFAAINDIWWSCNESGYECILKYLGTSFYDWWFDTDFPYVPTTVKFRIHDELDADEFNANQHLEQQSPINVWRDNWNQKEKETIFPHPVGTWRRTLKYSMGRVDQRPTHRYNDSDPSGGVDSHALTKTLMRPGALTPEESPCEWQQMNFYPADGLFVHWWGDHDDAPIQGPGEHDATFSVPDLALGEFRMPWPGDWDGDTKINRWYGFNWDEPDPSPPNPTRLPYFDSQGETFDQYDPEPDCDSRPAFEYEILKVEYDEPEHGDLDEGEIALVQAHLAMNERHDPIQVVSIDLQGTDVEMYEIYAEMLNQMREMLMNTRLRLYNNVNFDKKYWATYGIAQTLEDTLQDQIDRIPPLLLDPIPADPEDWFDTMQENAGIIPFHFDEAIGVNFQMAYFSGFDKYINDWSETGDEFSSGCLFARAIKINDIQIQDNQTIENLWVLSTLSYLQFPDGWPRSTGILENSEGEQTPYNARNWNDVNSFLPLAITDPSLESDWFTLIPAEPFAHSQVFEPWTPNGWGSNLNWDDDAIVNLNFSSTFIARHDWDLVPEEVFDTPNIKGLSECPSE